MFVDTIIVFVHDLPTKNFVRKALVYIGNCWRELKIAVEVFLIIINYKIQKNCWREFEIFIEMFF